LRIARWFIGGLLALALLAGALLLIADTSFGHRLIADRIAALAPASGLRVKIGRIEGSIYGAARLRDVRLYDARGLFFESNDVALDWKPFAYLSNVLDIESLTAPAARLRRLPKLVPSGKAGPILPSFDIRIGRLAVERLEIDAGVAGAARRGALLGKADIRSGRALVELAANTDGRDRLNVKLDAEPDRDRFDLSAAADAPVNGVLGALVGTKLPFAARIDGDGRWSDWRGSLVADASGKRVAQLALTARAGRYDVDGVLIPSAITTGRIAQLTGPQIRVKGNARLENRRLDTHVALASAALAGSANGIIDLANSRFDDMRIDVRLLQPAALVSNMQARNAQLAVRLNGEFASSAFDYLLTADQAAFGTTGFESVRASGQGRLSKAPINVPLRLTARRVTGVGDVAGGILANLSVDGVLRVSGALLTGDNLLVKSDKFNGRVTLLVDLATGRYDIGVAGALNRYLIPGLGIVDVKSVLKVVPGANGQGARVLGRGQVWVRRLDNNFLRELAGGLPSIETGLERQVDGVIRFTNLRLTAPDIRLTGNGYRRVDGTFHFEGAGTQRRYGPVQLILDGNIAKPTVDLILARPLDSAGLRAVRAKLVPNADGFAWTAAGGSLLGPFSGNGAIVLRGGQTLIDIARLEASGLVGRGQFRVVTGGIAGQLALSGSGINGTVALAPLGSGQRLEAHLTAKDARLNGPPLIAARRAQLDAVVLLGNGSTSIEGTMTGQGLRYGSLSLARLAANARLRGGVGEVRAAFAGSRGRTFDLQTVAQVSPDRIALIGQGTIDGKPIKLDSPAIATRSNGGWVLSPTALSFAGGQAKLSGRSDASALAADIDLARMPLTVLDVLSPDLGLGGIASGRVSFVQPANSSTPTGRIDVRVRNLSRAGLILNSKPIDLGIAGVLNGNGFAARVIAASGGSTIGQAQARITPGGGGDLATRLLNGALFAQLRYNGAADTLWRLTGIETIDLTGPVAVGADIGGTARNPQIRGSFQTTALRIESPLSGTVLTNVRAGGSFGGSRLVIPQFTAAAGRGTITGRAVFDLAAAKGFGIEITGQATNAEVIRRDDVGATVTGPLAIRSDGASGIISGDVVLDRSSFRLGQAKATVTIPQLNVREINKPLEAFEDVRPPQVWQLTIKARADSRLAVTGLGLDSEWSTDLDVGGTLNNPRIVGRADLVRGGYEFAGKRFELNRGIIRFRGEQPIDPTIDIEAVAANQSLTATVRVTGSGQRPDIAFTSTPALPQDELLSRLLFGTSITNLSAPEAVQLAAAVASLQGGGAGLNPINALRQAIGLDRLRILPADATTGAKTAVAAGKYITKRTYIELVSDGQGYSASRIEFQITRWLSLLSTISTIGRTSATVKISKDY
jgi:translocation and assembly module TamB